MMDWDAITHKLTDKLDPAHVRKPGGRHGPKGDYIEGWHAIAEANRIFGFGAWSYEIANMTQADLREAVNGRGEPQWQAAYVCTVRLTVGDVVREDVGFGSGFAKQIGDAVEGATKEAVTDALKRALRTFGNPFGLALYDKSGASVGVEPKPEDKRDWFMRAIEAAADVARLDTLEGSEKSLAAIASLPEHMQAQVLTALRDRRSALTQPDDGEHQDHRYG